MTAYLPEQEVQDETNLWISCCLLLGDDPDDTEIQTEKAIL